MSSFSTNMEVRKKLETTSLWVCEIRIGRTRRVILIKNVLFLPIVSTLAFLFCLTFVKTWSEYRMQYPAIEQVRESIEQALLNMRPWNFSYNSQRELKDLYLAVGTHHSLVRQSITLADSNFTYQMNLSQYQLEFPYLQSYSCSLVMDQTGFCKSQGKPLLLLAIKSHPESFQRRAAIRQTWARVWEIGGMLVKSIFLMALSENAEHSDLVAKEDLDYRDILLWDFEESHHNLSLKERCFIEWLYLNCQEAEFIFKGDDDEFVNPVTVVKYISDFVNFSTTVHGHLMVHSDVMREGKYKVSETLYPLQKYPTFLSGGGFIIPGESIPALHHASIVLPVFPLDDVYFGFLLLAANLTYRHDTRFCVSKSETENCKFLETLVVHGIPPHTLLHIWRGFQPVWNWKIPVLFLVFCLVVATLRSLRLFKQCYNVFMRVLLFLPSNRTHCRF